ncbi:unnamed protein product [Thlaspi arvense]|uniref:Uncharacterized protein n=1 Tax=Thlaspi arvense TaxID=13288 RepID=A0AAU9SPH4_THLAR|nr:unnamed protein product [Thlaspi arvense]
MKKQGALMCVVGFRFDLKLSLIKFNRWEELGMADPERSELVPEAGRSPTSPLDFRRVFSPKSPSPRLNKWFCDKVGLSVVSSEKGWGDDGSFRRDNIVLAPQIKAQLCAVDEYDSNAAPRPQDIIIIPTREMALSEDYTCIISHGPNPKTTHIFGDCILDCDPKEFGGLEKHQAHHDSFSRQPHQHRPGSKESVEQDSSPGSSYNERG